MLYLASDQTADVTHNHKWPHVFHPSHWSQKKTHEKGENETCEYGTCARMTRNYCCLKKVYSFKVYTSAVCSICLVDNKRVSFENNEKLQHLFMFDVFRGWRGRSPPYEKITQIITNRGFDSAGFNVRGWRVFSTIIILIGNFSRVWFSRQIVKKWENPRINNRKRRYFKSIEQALSVGGARSAPPTLNALIFKI